MVDDETFQYRRTNRSEHDFDESRTVCAEGQLYLTVYHASISIHNGISFIKMNSYSILLTD
jgi:hypothetical protein